MAGTGTIGAILGALEGLMPPAKAASWDPVGLQLGDADAAAHRVGVCHEVTEAVVDAAEAESLDLLVSYHPLLFRPTRRLVAGAGSEGRAFRLIKAGVALAVVHTAFDVAAGGTADALADALGLEDVVGFAPLWRDDAVRMVTFVPATAADAVADAMAAAGAGRVGAYTRCAFRVEGEGIFFAPGHSSPAAGRSGTLNREPEIRLEMSAPESSADAVVVALVAAHPYEEPAFDVFERRGDAGMVGRVGRLPEPVTLQVFAVEAKERLGGVMRLAGRPEAEVATVAAVPGSGGDLVGAAASAGADVLVTGDVSHHQARNAAELGMTVADPGHAATERPGLEKLYAAVSGMADDVADLTGLDADPWSSV